MQCPLPDYYWFVSHHGMAYYLADNIGEQLKEKVVRFGSSPTDPEFTEVEDLSGEPVVFQFRGIVQMYRSSPASREWDDQVHDFKKSNKNWGADA